VQLLITVHTFGEFWMQSTGVQKHKKLDAWFSLLDGKLLIFFACYAMCFLGAKLGKAQRTHDVDVV
jgi:hypothetical protein